MTEILRNDFKLLNNISVTQIIQQIPSYTQFVYLGNSLDQAALNAANETGTLAEIINSPFVGWPGLKKFENDQTYFGQFQDPSFVWDLPTQNSELVYFGAASFPFIVSENSSFSGEIITNVFADNALEMKIELYKKDSLDTYTPATPQPGELSNIMWAGTPDQPQTGLSETSSPYNWQFIRFNFSHFTCGTPGDYKIVFAFKARNYSIPPEGTINPAGLQFVTNIIITIIQETPV